MQTQPMLDRVAGIAISLPNGHRGMQDIEITALQDRYLDDLEYIVAEGARAGEQRILLLSGGTDSLVLAVILTRVFPRERLRTLTIAGAESADSNGAEAVAAKLGTDHTTRILTLDEVVAHLNVVRGCNYGSIRKVLSHICYYLTLGSEAVVGSAVYTGHGADKLYGNEDSVIAGANALAARLQVPINEARTRLKAEHYAQSQESFFAGDPSEAGQHVSEIVAGLGARCVLPYRDPRLAYLSEVPSTIIPVDDKTFVESALRRRFDLTGIERRRSIGMQDGTGLYQPFKTQLRSMFPQAGSSSREIAAYLSR